jgi:hypothetical protein
VQRDLENYSINTVPMLERKIAVRRRFLGFLLMLRLRICIEPMRPLPDGLSAELEQAI